MVLIPMALCYWIFLSPNMHIIPTAATISPCVGAVEIGFANCSYTVGESESSVVVCVEVKSGELTPAETALATVSTLPGTALGEVLVTSILY